MNRAVLVTTSVADVFRQPLGRRLRPSLAASALIFLLCCRACAANEQILRPLGPPLEAAGSYDASPSTRRSVSGIACDRDEKRSRHKCVIALDEGAEARFAELGTGYYHADGAAVVLSQNQIELDAEGAATDGTYFYLTGSHSVKREDCAENPGSRVVMRFPVAADVGIANSDRSRPAGLVTTDKLWKRLSEFPELGANKCLKHAKGLNIEGLAAKGDRLFFGLRGPAADGAAFVASVDKNALFSKSATDLQLRIKRLDVAPGHGVRDMAAVNDGFLLIVGPDDRKDDKALASMLALWDGQSSKPRILGAFALDDVKLRTGVNGCDDKELKPEAILVREDAGDHFAVTVLFDGMCDGGPLEFLVTR